MIPLRHLTKYPISIRYSHIRSLTSTTMTMRAPSPSRSSPTRGESQSKEVTRAEKKALRRKMDALLKTIPDSILEKESSLVTKTLMASHTFKSSHRIAVYLSMPNSEIRTDEIIRTILQDPNKTCYIPRCTKNEMDMVLLKDLEDWESLPLNAWNIPEPPLNEPRENALASPEGLDLVIVPGVAFSRDGQRLGHGKGYYDKFFSKTNKLYKEGTIRTVPKKIAVALSQQIVHDPVPRTELDVKLDAVIAPTEIIGDLE